MGVSNDIAEAIRAIAQQKRNQRTNWKLAKVVSVDGGYESCAVSISGDTYTDVRLNAVVNCSCDFHIVPVVGSFVMVADLSNGNMDDLAVVMFSQVDRIEIGTAEHTTANADVLKDELEKLSARVDIILEALTTAKPTAYSDGGASLMTVIKGIIGNPQREDWYNIQNDKIKHG